MISLLPITLIEKILHLIILMLESTPKEIRLAQAIVWWALWWPVLKLFLKKETEEQIEKLVGGITSPDTVSAARDTVSVFKSNSVGS